MKKGHFISKSILYEHSCEHFSLIYHSRRPFDIRGLYISYISPCEFFYVYLYLIWNFVGLFGWCNFYTETQFQWRFLPMANNHNRQQHNGLRQPTTPPTLIGTLFPLIVSPAWPPASPMSPPSMGRVTQGWIHLLSPLPFDPWWLSPAPCLPAGAQSSGGSTMEGLRMVQTCPEICVWGHEKGNKMGFFVYDCRQFDSHSSGTSWYQPVCEQHCCIGITPQQDGFTVACLGMDSHTCGEYALRSGPIMKDSHHCV